MRPADLQLFPQVGGNPCPPNTEESPGDLAGNPP